MFRFRLHVNRNRIGAGLNKARRVVIGVLDHQMHIQRQLRFFAHNANNFRPERNVIDEMSVHNVAMNPISPGLLDAMNFVSQPRKIRG